MVPIPRIPLLVNQLLAFRRGNSRTSWRQFCPLSCPEVESEAVLRVLLSDGVVKDVIHILKGLLQVIHLNTY